MIFTVNQATKVQKNSQHPPHITLLFRCGDGQTARIDAGEMINRRFVMLQ